MKTTISDKATSCPLDRVNRQFQTARPNALWVSDFTYVATWRGFVYFAFVIDTFARRTAGWRISRTAHADFVLDALEQALHGRIGRISCDEELCFVALFVAGLAADVLAMKAFSDVKRH